MNNELKKLIVLERLKSHLAKLFNKTEQELNEFLESEVLNKAVNELSPKELNELAQKTDNKVQSLLLAYVATLKENWQSLFDLQMDWLMVGKKFKRVVFDKAIFKEPLSLAMGLSLDDIVAKFTKEQSQKLVGVIRLAYHQGLTNQKLSVLIRGTKARQYQDGVVSVMARGAKTIARTGTAVVASQSKQAFIESNRDLIVGIQIIATLDGRTSPICRHLDKQIMPLDKATYPPYHYNCRSSFIYVMKDHKEPPKRASMNGVVDNVSYYEWLKSQTADFQDEVLGKTRAKLFRSDMSLERFKQLQLDKHFNPLTLEQIRQLEPSYFDEA